VSENSDDGVADQVKDKVAESVRAADKFQRRHESVGVAVAVFRKFADDRATNLASMIAFWAFFSIFPLFLVFVTLLGYLLPADIKAKVLDTVSGMLPLLDPNSMHSLSGAWWALLIGLVSALWSGLSAVRNTEYALNFVWDIPDDKQPTLVKQVLRGLGVLATIGLGLVVATLVSGFVAGAANGLHLGWAGRLLGYVIAIVLDVSLFVAAFRMLTGRDVTTREVLPGALLSGVAFFVLQSLSSLIISRYLQHAQSTYGHFATVITLLWWLYLQSIITLLGAELNVVLKRRLHPQPLVDDDSTKGTGDTAAGEAGRSRPPTARPSSTARR
jgi:membrane protein